MDDISEKSSDEVQDPISYLDKCIDMASVIYDAIDIDKLEQNKKQNIEYLTAIYHSTQGGLSDEERQLTLSTLNSKKEVLEQYGDEFYVDLQNINQAALEFILGLCVEDMHYNSIEVLDLLYSAIKIRPSYVRMMLDAHELLTKIPNNDRNQDDIDLAENQEQKLSKSVETYKDKIKHILQKWINLVMDLKSKSKSTIDMCCKIKDSKDYNVIAFDTSKVTDNSIDLHYEYSMSFAEFVATQCFFDDNVESIIPYILNDNYYKNVLIDTMQFSNLESLAFEKTLQKYLFALGNRPEKSKYEEKLLAWYQDTKDRYVSLQPAIEMCCNLIEIYVENSIGMNENEKARFLEDMEKTIVSMQNAQSRILKLMQHGPDIVPPKE